MLKQETFLLTSTFRTKSIKTFVRGGESGSLLIPLRESLSKPLILTLLTKLTAMQKKRSRMNRLLVTLLAAWFILAQPSFALAQAVDAGGNATGPTEPTGAPECTGASCNQGVDQGLNQGYNQGVNQGLSADVTASNENTGADSNNNADVSATNSATNTTNNTATDTTAGTATGSTGGNAANANTGSAAVSSGNAGIGVTQVKNDNSTVVGGSAGLSVQGTNGDHNGDLNLGVGSGTADLSNGSSVKATNQTTGSDSTNTVGVSTTSEQITEVQNDGEINNLLDLAAITGQNSASQNTGNGTVSTGDADVAATLVNLLNTTVVNGNLWVTVADIFGDLNGNIIIPELSGLSGSQYGNTFVNAGNNDTGANSDNVINVGINENDTTRINNDADINTIVNASAITGQNEALSNTGGGVIETGNGSAQASSVSLANTTIEGGNWALVIISALNGWFGFLVGDSGQVKALSQEETIRQIEAQNNNTGADSTNTIDVEHTDNTVTTVDNDAEINNMVNAAAITGQNTASENTGQGKITTGDAAVSANAVNIANTTVKNGSLLIAVVNIFGDWFGDLLYKGGSVLAAAAAQNPTVTVDANNSHTGAGSENEVNVDVNRQKTTSIDNNARVTTTLNATIDTGSNKTNKNTLGGSIITGNSAVALHSRAVANTTGIAMDPALNLEVRGLNDTTGFDSQNRINARLNDERVIDINNDANISTIFGIFANTGNNEASQNTLGGSIVTGSAVADVSIQNMVNKILFALAHGGAPEGSVEADLINRLTGALSLNSNNVEANYQTLIDILNRGVVNNLVDMLLNTGGNVANDNTDGATISTGEICVNGNIENDVNDAKHATKAGTDVTIDQLGVVNNVANVNAQTGNNTLERNTKGSSTKQAGECPTIAVAPTPSPTPGPSGGGNNGGGGNGGGVGGGDTTEESKSPKVAGITSHDKKKPPMIMSEGKLKRFPVAGGENVSKLFQGKAGMNWILFAITSAILLGVAWRMDRQKKLLPVRVSL